MKGLDKRGDELKILEKGRVVSEDEKAKESNKGKSVQQTST